VLKSWHTSRGPEQGVWYCSVDGLTQRFVSFVFKANCCYISVLFVTSADIILLFQHEKNSPTDSFFGNDADVVCTEISTLLLGYFFTLLEDGEWGIVVDDITFVTIFLVSVILQSAILVKILEWLGGSSVPYKNGKTREVGGSEISFMLGVWVFSGTTHFAVMYLSTCIKFWRHKGCNMQYL